MNQRTMTPSCLSWLFGLTFNDVMHGNLLKAGNMYTSLFKTVSMLRTRAAKMDHTLEIFVIVEILFPIW